MATLFDIIEENNRRARRMEADLYDMNYPYSQQKLGPTIPLGGSIFTNRFENFNPRIGETGIQQVVNPYEYTFNEDVLKEEEDAQYFPEEKNIFQRSYDYLNDPTKNAQRGIMSYLLTANPLVAAASFFAPKIIGGIGNIRNNMSDFITNLFNKPAAQIPANTFFGDTDMTRGGGGATTGSGQSVSSSDLSSIGNTGFSEYSSPGVAASYEGSS